jgi:hypothetical protein
MAVHAGGERHAVVAEVLLQVVEAPPAMRKSAAYRSSRRAMHHQFSTNKSPIRLTNVAALGMKQKIFRNTTSSGMLKTPMVPFVNVPVVTVILGI